MNDVITIYSKDSSRFDRTITMRMIQCEKTFERSFDFKRFIFNVYPNHSDYHRDEFDRNNPHLHVQFSIAIDEGLFDECITVLFDGQLITSNERKHLMTAYHQASFLEEGPQMFYSSEEQNLKKQLILLRLKANQLIKQAYFSTDVARAARELYEGLSSMLEVYCSNRTIASFIFFKRNARNLITNAAPILSPYEELKQFIGSFVPMFSALGAGYVSTRALSAIVNSRFSLFNTGVENHLVAIADGLDGIFAP
jgi:hypothetical protein